MTRARTHLCSNGIVAPLLVALWLCAAPLGAIDIVVDRTDGELFLHNPGEVAETIDAYSISSVTDAIDSGAWISVTDAYALSGDMSVDAVSDWFEISRNDGFDRRELSHGALRFARAGPGG